MKKFIAMAIFVMIAFTSFSNENDSTKITKKREVFIYSEVLFCPGNFNIFRTGVIWKGFYPFVEVDEFNQDYKFRAGLAYDGMVKNTGFRVLGNVGEKGFDDFFGFVMVYQNLNLKPLNIQPIIFCDWNLEMTVGFFLPYPLGKHATVALWVYKPIKEPNVGGFKIGPTRCEIDLFFKF